MLSTVFRDIVWAHYKKLGRHDLPWRKTRDPYKILVSEVMLQQTQVERVIPFYTNFLKQFPSVETLAAAPLADVLRAWQGLGYNRRAKMLHAAAKTVVAEYKGKFPKTRIELETLPGIGPYTAGAVAAFAYNKDVIFIETNIRTAVTHHFFANKKSVSDREIIKILEQVFSKGLPAGRQGKSREWYSALMDYGSYLKKSGVKINNRSKHYNKQSKFSGSLREARGAILRALSAGQSTRTELTSLLGLYREPQLREALTVLVKEGIISIHRGKYSLAT